MTMPRDQFTDHAIELQPIRHDLAFDHGAISGFNVWFFTALARYINHMARHLKRSAFANLPAGVILEIGAGTGANLGYLEPGTHLYALEPSLRMHQGLRRRCAAAGVELTVLGTGAEAIPLPDNSVDEVICSLVLCTVADPAQVLDEVRRVLRPAGRFRFVEHTAASRRGIRRLLQRAIRRPWGYLFEGCDPSRQTPDTIAAAGFSSVEFERVKLRHSPFWPVNTATWGVAVN